MHIVDLVTFSRVQHLDTHFYPFVKMTGIAVNKEVKGDTLVLIFKVRKTLDSHQVIIVNRDTTLERVEQELINDLDCILSDSARKKLAKIFKNEQKSITTYVH